MSMCSWRRDFSRGQEEESYGLEVLGPTHLQPRLVVRTSKMVLCDWTRIFYVSLGPRLMCVRRVSCIVPVS